MEPESTSGARQAITAAGVTGAALLLTVAAAVPALAGTTGTGDQGERHSAAGQVAADRHGESAPHRAGAGHRHGHGHGTRGADGTDGADRDAAGTADPADDDATSATHGRAGDHGRPATAPAGSPTDGHNPPGNNGTVFIHDVAGDYSPHNVPHVPCTFYADFFGFDAGQQVTVSFAGQAPTGMGTPLGGSWTGTVSDDDAGGAGQDFDLELPFSADTLGVTDLGAPHPKQGYHVKMTVLTNEPGGKKSKVFWIAPCTDTAGTAVGGTDTEAGGTPDESAGTGTTVEGATVEGATVESGGTTAAGTTAPASDVPTTVMGEQFSKGALGESAAAGVGSLPFTGAEIGGLLAVGAAALAGGLALTVAGRRRRTAAVSSDG